MARPPGRCPARVFVSDSQNQGYADSENGKDQFIFHIQPQVRRERHHNCRKRHPHFPRRQRTDESMNKRIRFHCFFSDCLKSEIFRSRPMFQASVSFRFRHR